MPWLNWQGLCKVIHMSWSEYFASRLLYLTTHPRQRPKAVCPDAFRTLHAPC